jgi:S-DNA-T family DNA segregation ATPase FtsK/SpoIIIE
VDSTAEEPVIPAQRGAPAGQSAAPKSGEQKPILTPWMKYRAEFTGKMRDVGKRAAHTVGWHLWHALTNALRVLWFAPRGLWRIIRNIWRWVSDAEEGSLRQDAIAKNNHNDYFKHSKLRDERASRRCKQLAALTTLALIGVALLLWLAPAWLLWTLAAAGVAGLGYAGRPRNGKPLILPATAPTGATPLTNDIVLESLCSLDISKMTRPEDIELLYGVKPARAGYNIDLTLPRGVTATEIMAKREKLSSGLQRGIGTV